MTLYHHFKSKEDLIVEGAIIHMEVFREPQVARIADDAAQKLVDKVLG